MGGVSGAPIRVVLAEDDYLVREGACALLEPVEDVSVVGAASNPQEFAELFDRHEVDVAILDIRMPPTFTTEGIDIAERLRAHDPPVGVVMLSQHADPEYVLELLGDGSDRIAYLLKERLNDVDQLVRAIREVAAGGSVVDPKIVGSLMEAQQRRADSPLSDLTPREREVVAHMASGSSNAAIADALHISERSVEKHTGAIFRKFDLPVESEVNRRVAAVVFFLQRQR